MTPTRLTNSLYLVLISLICNECQAVPPIAIPGTETLSIQGDIADEMLTGIHRFLDRQIEDQRTRRSGTWPKPDSSLNTLDAAASSNAYRVAITPLRDSLAYRIGVREARLASPQLRMDTEWTASNDSRSAHAEDREPQNLESEIKVVPVLWQVFDDIVVHGLSVSPPNPQAIVIAIPDAEQAPEDLCGIGTDTANYAIELAKLGVQVFVPEVIQRTDETRNGRVVVSDQEFLYRSSFVLGRHPLGYQVQVVQSLIDAIKAKLPKMKIGLAGWGEGGWIALHTAALDDRVSEVLVAGHFQQREEIWKEPIHRNVHGLLLQFGDAELAAMIAPRKVLIDAVDGPMVRVSGKGAAPGELIGPVASKVDAEWNRARSLLEPWNLLSSLDRFDSEQASAPKANKKGQPSSKACERLVQDLLGTTPKLVSRQVKDWKPAYIPEERRLRTLRAWDRHQQRQLDLIHLERAEYWRQLKTSSLQEFQSTVSPYRDDFSENIIGKWSIPKAPMNARSRLVKSIDGVSEYEVVLDVFEDVFAFGKLLVPGELTENGRPCVVFQHGLEGRPDDTIAGDHPAYHDVSMQLAKRGYIVFAPQNLYLFEDRFRELQRKSNPLGKTLFSTMVAQHEVIVAWLAKQSFIDPNRIAFYGLSYGGKSAMRIPALVPGYCLSICSADFNDWVWKNASTSSPYSYVWTKEYEIFEFDLGPKFNYAEMATLIAPRPFMVERGHFDGVAPDERVGAEYAKVNRLYSALLKIPDRTRIEWFPGPHTIHGQGTFEFLDKHLNHDGQALSQKR